MSGIEHARAGADASGASSRSIQGLRVAIVGATGAVGEVLLGVLEERGFPAAEIVPLASGRSAGRDLLVRGRPVPVLEATPEAFEGIDLVFFAATGSLSKQLAPEAVARGAVVIDKSNTWRMDPAVPLVVPEINVAALDDHRGIIACPNCTTIGVVMALAPVHALAGIERVVVTTFQAVTGAGRAGLEELEAQREAGSASKPQVFAARIDANVVALCGDLEQDGYTGEEMKLLHETRKILALPKLPISVTCTRVPVRVGHSASVFVETSKPVTPDAVRARLAESPGIRLVDDPAAGAFPTPLDAEGGDAVLVGRVRSDFDADGRRLWLWEASDNLRKGAATNAVQIAEALIARGLLGTRAAQGDVAVEASAKRVAS